MTTTAAQDDWIRPAPAAPSRYLNLIGGRWVEPSGVVWVPNVNPADTTQVLGDVPRSRAADVAAAVEAAEKAFTAWRDMPAPLRGRIIFRALELLRAEAEELATILTLEEGKTWSESHGEVLKSLNVLEFMAGEGRRIAGETAPSEMPATFCYTIRQPLGVVAAITPWNFPVAIPCWKIAPALVAGNTVVWKPASLTPWTADRVARVFVEAGVPEGVLNLVHGSGGEVGEALVSHPRIRAVSFTGSNEVGTGIYAGGARRMMKVQCEMGGKNPLVVLEDADLEFAADATAQGAFGSTGQRCTATSRAIVVESIADRFAEMVVARAKRLKPGNGLRRGVTLGPSVDEKQMQTVMRFLEAARAAGSARLLTGGGRVRDPECERGFFVEPTVYDHVAPGDRLAQEEIFGPVLAIIRVRNFEEAVEVANGVAYGLSSSIYSQDVSRIFRFIDRIETGITHVNSPTVGGEAHLPFGGMKATGVGEREQGKVAVDFYTELKTVYVDYTGRKRETNIY
jgi:aldehyde dehydrogenase (NAD+)